MLTKEELASKLDGNEIYKELEGIDEKELKESKLIVMFGYSDDNVEMRGNIDDEISAYGRVTIRLNSNGIVTFPNDESCEDCALYQKLINGAKEIEAEYGDDGVWRFETEIPHSTFKIMEDGELFCIGIVFRADDV